MATMPPADATAASAEGETVAVAADQAFVRILGIRLGRYVEFEYSLGDGTLAVELILPSRAFEDFCRERRAIVRAPDPQTAETLEQIAWRAGHPGLLRRTGATPDRDD